MHQLLAIAILVIAGVFLGLTGLIVVNKAWRETLRAGDQRRRARLEPKLLAYAHGQDGTPLAAVGGTPTRFERRVIEQILLDHAQRVRGTEHDRLARAFEEFGLVEAYLDGLRSRRWWRRAECAERLGIAGARRAVEALVPSLRDEVSEVRMRAAKALGTLGGASSIRHLILALDQPNRWSTIRIADILTGLGRRVVDELTGVFDQLGVPGKIAALDILGRIRPLHGVAWLERRLHDPERDVRARACHALGCIGDPGSTPRLVRALEDPEWPVRAMAAKSLGRISAFEAIPALSRAMADPEWWVRSNAARALRAMGSRGLRALDAMLEADDRYARHQAVLMLQEMGYVDLQARRLVRADGAERQQAESFLRRVVAVGQLDRLRALAEDESEPGLREAIGALLPQEARA